MEIQNDETNESIKTGLKNVAEVGTNVEYVHKPFQLEFKNDENTKGVSVDLPFNITFDASLIANKYLNIELYQIEKDEYLSCPTIFELTIRIPFLKEVP